MGWARHGVLLQITCGGCTQCSEKFVSLFLSCNMCSSCPKRQQCEDQGLLFHSLREAINQSPVSQSTSNAPGLVCSNLPCWGQGFVAVSLAGFPPNLGLPLFSFGDTVYHRAAETTQAPGRCWWAGMGHGGRGL